MTTEPASSHPREDDPRLLIGLLLLLLGMAALIGTASLSVSYAAAIVLLATFVALAAYSPSSALMVLVVYAEVVAGFVKILSSGSTAAAAVADVLALIVLAATLFRYGLPTLRGALDRLVLAYIGLVLIVSVLNQSAPGGVQLAGGVRTLVLYLPFYFLARTLLSTRAAEHRLVAWLVGGAGLLGLISMLQYAKGASWSQSHHLAGRVVLDWGTSSGGFRPASLFPLPGVAGVVFAAMLVVNMVVLLHPEGRDRRLYVLPLPLIAFGLMASGQRAAILGCGVALIVVAVVARSRLLLGLVLIAGGLLIATLLISSTGTPVGRVSVGVSGGSTHSTQTRFHTWSVVVRQLPYYPFGHGPGYTGSSAYRFGSRTGATPRVTTDNYWVKQLWEVGIAGAVWYTALLVLALRAAYLAYRRRSDLYGQAVTLTVCGLLAQQVPTAWFTNVLDPSPYNLIFWLMLGLIRTPARTAR